MAQALQDLTELQQRLASAPAVLVRVASVQGSGPREAGAWMAVFADAVVNTLGGGHLEFEAIARARQRLAQAEHGRAAASTPAETLERFALGPSLGQCCGGVVHLRVEPVTHIDWPRLQRELQPRLQPLALFGGGHVGRALVHLLATLPFAVRWIDSRDEIFPARVPAHVACEHSDPVHDAVADLAPGSQVLIMSFSHAEDLDIVAACLKRQRERRDLPFIGLIGSATKWATFRHRLEARGFAAEELAQVTCPIGVPGIAGKQPEVIAVAVTAQLLQQGRHLVDAAPSAAAADAAIIAPEPPSDSPA
ncbi:MAG: xanthine dehydrogenase accessory protein XdhC [Burkholderiaceae bacterium]